MAFFFSLGHALKEKRKHRRHPQPGVDYCSRYEAYRSAVPMMRAGYGPGMGSGGHKGFGHNVHPAVKEGILAAAEDGDSKAISFAQRRGWLVNDPYAQAEAPGHGSLGGVFANRGHHGSTRGAHGGSHRGSHHGGHRGGHPRGGHRGGHHDALAGGFGPSDAEEGEDGGALPGYVEDEADSTYSPPPGMGGGRGRGRGLGSPGHGIGHPTHPMMGSPGMSSHSMMGHHGHHGHHGNHGHHGHHGHHGYHEHGHGRGGGRGHLPSAPHGW